MQVVELEHRYDASARRVWAMATDYDSLARVCRGLLSFRGLPEGRTEEGQRLKVKVSLFGVLPPQDYEMHVIQCDDETMLLRSEEFGSGVERWAHTLRVSGDEDSATLSDRIEIEAGWLTPIFSAWARVLYARRHAPRVAMLQAGAF